MSATKEVKWPFIVNLSNSIIGVSLLAMPFCLMQCGILLGSLLIVGSNILTRVTSHLLLKGTHICRRRSYELYSLHLFGAAGKTFIELMTVCFLLSTCCAFFVVIGDLGPHILADFFGITTVTGRLRIFVMVLIGVWLILPLSLLRNIDSLSSVSSLAILFYGFFVVRMLLESLPNLLTGQWFYEVNWWRPEGVLKSLPIIGLSLSCQTNLFSTAEAMVEYSPARMDSVVAGAVNLCSSVYMAVGFLGYVAYYEKPIAGDVLVYLESSFFTQLIKFAFMLSVAVSFPLMLFPCRTAIFSMIQKSGPSQDLSVEIIPDVPFRLITFFLILATLVVAIMVPQVEFILGLTGSLIGSAVCIIGPSFMYLQIAPQHHFYSRISAQVCMVVGFFILIVCTYATLHDVDTSPVVQVAEVLNAKSTNSVLPALHTLEKPAPLSGAPKDLKGGEKEDDAGQRKEPPLPQEDSKDDGKGKVKGEKVEAEAPKKVPSTEKGAEINVKQAVQLVRELKNQQEESKKLLEEQKQLIQELKDQKEQKVENLAQQDQQDKAQLPLKVPNHQPLPDQKEQKVENLAQQDQEEKAQLPLKAPSSNQPLPVPADKGGDSGKRVVPDPNRIPPEAQGMDMNPRGKPLERRQRNAQRSGSFASAGPYSSNTTPKPPKKILGSTVKDHNEKPGREI